MRALVPTGGSGSRLRPLTYTRAKQLIPVANRPILFSVLDDLAEAGITEAVLVVGDTGDEIRAAVGDGSAFGLTVVYVEQDAPRGLADTVRISREALGDEPFVMYLGDNLLRDGIVSLVRAYETAPVAAQILVVQVPDPQRFGVVALDQTGAVIRVEEKPAVPPSDLALAGIYVFDARVHAAIAGLSPSARGELEITEAIQALIDDGAPVVAQRAEGWWKDTGTVEALLEANRLVLSDLPEDRWIDPTADVTGSTITGPVSIAAGAIVRGCVIEPYTSIGSGSTVLDSTIANSVIMPSCEITAVDRLCDSLLGLGVTVSGDGSTRPHRLTVGDHGQVALG